MLKRLICILGFILVLNMAGFALAEGEVMLLEQIDMTFEDIEPVYDRLKYGMDGQEVTDLQTKLAELGYYNGNISGRYREGTRAAIREFQSDYGLDVTGEADADVQAALYQAKYRALERGDSGEDVKRLQARLTELGYYNGKLSGDYLEGTTAGIKSFQKKTGLEQTGKADVLTQEAIFSEDAYAKDAATPLPSPRIAVAEDGSVAAQPEKYTMKLTRGATGKPVKLVQQRLTDLGFYTGPITGNYMNQTMAGVKLFQEYNGLKVDGITGEDTWNAMFNREDVVPSNATPRPTPEPTPIPYALTVDVTNQVVKVYGVDENREYTNLIKTMICSTGTKSFPSDVGDWVLNGRTARWCYFPKWGSHAQYWTRINSSIAFHSVIYNTVDTMDLSVKSYKALGSRASHGCIRLLVSDAKWIYDNVGKGTVVTITEDLPLDEELTKSLKPAELDRSRMLPKETPQPTPEPAFDGTEKLEYTRTLEKGDQGEDVFWVQTVLKKLGYYNGTVTGSFYSGTQEAVKAFQKDNGINGKGQVGKKTWAALVEAMNPTPSSEPTPALIATPEPAETSAPAESVG